MARASHIYLIVQPSVSTVGAALHVGAFTVKHEAALWLRQHPARLDTLEVHRFKDGRPKEGCWVRPAREFLE